MAETTSAAWFVGGKYHRPTLASQNGFCWGNICTECMSDRWPNPWNMFDTGNWHNCNGIIPSPLVATDKWFLWGPGEWAWFLILGQAQDLQETVDFCRQNFYDVNCAYAGPNGPEPVAGAYYVGSEFGLEDLDGMIDRLRTGWPGWFDPTPFEAARSYIESAYADMNFPGDDQGWFVILQGAFRYLVHLDIGDGPPPAVVDGQVVSVPHTPASQADINFAAKLVIHALVAWQSWEGGREAQDLLTEDGIEPFCVSADDDCAPTFIYMMWIAYEDIVRPYVSTVPSTWGGIKALYKNGGE